ncbi:hypothetical protein K4A76_19010 [Pseudomonas sp. NEEL19]|uniref:hypothetical protein n=1 Tax=Pseudomonas sp. NEEL19 TaxID=2867409 RepID=UPI002368A997|nr:hypothetical protein [Pseudomonas sp. NEEL19]WDM58516.1 hypothetical protein K4A76_19010 [Pseudomonas sp. NEEL19]
MIHPPQQVETRKDKTDQLIAHDRTVISTCCCHVDVIYKDTAATPAVKQAEQVQQGETAFSSFLWRQKSITSARNTGAGATVHTFSDEF